MPNPITIHKNHIAMKSTSNDNNMKNNKRSRPGRVHPQEDSASHMPAISEETDWVSGGSGAAEMGSLPGQEYSMREEDQVTTAANGRIEEFSNFLNFLWAPGEGGPPPGSEGLSWECPVCTYLNENPLHLACAMCGAPKVNNGMTDGIKINLVKDKQDGIATSLGNDGVIENDPQLPPAQDDEQNKGNADEYNENARVETVDDNEAPLRATQVAANWYGRAVDDAQDGLEPAARKKFIMVVQDGALALEGRPNDHTQAATDTLELSTSPSAAPRSASPETQTGDSHSTPTNETHTENLGILPQQSVIQPPSTSTPSHPNYDGATESSPTDESSLPQLEATLVEDQVYDAVAIQNNLQEQAGDVNICSPSSFCRYREKGPLESYMEVFGTALPACGNRSCYFLWHQPHSQ